MVKAARVLVWIGLIVLLGIGPGAGPWQVIAPAFAQDQGQVPGGALGNSSDAEFWRSIRRGESFTTSLPDNRGGLLIQSEGDNWRAFRNGPPSPYRRWALL